MAAGNVGNINVSLSAEAIEFQRGVTAALKDFSVFAAGIVGGVKVVTAGFDAIGAAVSYGYNEFKTLTLESLNTIDKLNDMSQRLKVSVSELQQLGFAAEQSGGSAEGMRNALDRMTKSIGDANAGSKETQGAFNALGLAADQMAGNSATQNFKLIADAISRLPNPSMQASAAMDIFGKSYTEILGTLQTGSAGIDEASNRFKYLRGEISQFDASQIGKANDMLNELKQVLGAVGDAGAKELSIYIIAIGNALIDAGFNAKTFGGYLEASLRVAGKWTATLIDDLILLSKGIQAVSSGNVKPFWDALVSGDNDKFSKAFDKMIQDVNRLREEFEKPAKEKGFLGKFFSGIAGDTFAGMKNSAGGKSGDKNPGDNSDILELAMKEEMKVQDAYDKFLGESYKSESEALNRQRQLEDKAIDDYISALDRKKEESQKWADEQAEILKQPAELLQDYANKLLENDNLTASQKESLLSKKALDLGGESFGQASARAVDRNLSIEGLRMNEKKAEQKVSAPDVVAKLQEMIALIQRQNSTATAGG